MRILSGTLVAAAMAFGLIGCNGAGYSDGGGGYAVNVSLQGQFEKATLTPSGFTGGLTQKPIRYCYYEFRDASSNQVVANGFLDGSGQATTQIASGESVYAVIWAEYQVPSASSSSTSLIHGSVLDVPPPAAGSTGDQQVSYFNSAFPNHEWYVTSTSFVASSDGTLTVTAKDDSNRIAGAFNIADQAVLFARTLESLNTSLTLPDLHTYWNTSTAAADQARLVTAPLLNSAGSIQQLSYNGRAVFTNAVLGNGSGAANTETDEYDDAVLQETFARLLFADFSLKANGSSGLSFLRRDNDNVTLNRTAAAEPSAAFVDGWCAFMAGAALQTPQLLDSYVDGSGHAQVDDFDLSVPYAGNEFTSASIATNLWAVWRGPLGGNQAGLQTLWNGTLSNSPSLQGVGDYNGAPLGCYPTYLLGVENSVSGATWTSITGTFAASGISNPTPTYFSGSSLWVNEGTIPFSASGSLHTYPLADYRYYDQDQAASFRFVQGTAGSRTLTMTPSGGQDFEMDLIGPGGLVAWSYSGPFAGTRTLTQTLQPGSYVVRVRANPSSTVDLSEGNYSFTVGVQ